MLCLGLMLLRSNFFIVSGSPSIQCKGEVTKMLYWGLMLLRSRLFYCLQLPIHPMLEGGDPNAILGVIKVMGVNAASQQTLFIVSGSQSIQY